jgi:hypothetical protein
MWILKSVPKRIFSCVFNTVPPIDHEKIKDLGEEVVKQTLKKMMKKSGKKYIKLFKK